MRIRRCASRLLGSAASSPALPAGFELPPPPPTAHESHAGFLAASLEPCELSRSPWDLMAQLHPSDPQEEALFLETYFVAVAWRTSWLFQPSMPSAGSIKEEQQQKDEDMADEVIFELRMAARKTAKKKNEIKVKEEYIAGEVPTWPCKKNDGRRWFCRRPVSQPDSFCAYHTDQKPPAGITKPRKRAAADEGFYYYAGFGPSRSKRHRVSSSGDTLPEPPPAGPKEGAPPEEEKHIELVTAGQAQADCSAGHQRPAAASACVDDEARCEDIAGIAGGDEESTDDDDVVQPRDIKTKSPLKKRWRKPVKARSLKSLMM